MIPVQLTIEGLYSYQERQTIDFKDLTEAGIFGIFGAVGSGKSSILEAISFALYGETERLNSRDKRAYNMMNLKSNSSYIEFDFINHENKIFRAKREFKRNSKKFDDVKPSSVMFYEKINNQWTPLEHTDCEKIVGLSYANFKRTIIIPQGQFKEFLELGAAERTTMMKEIFNLQRFDLQGNISVLHVKNRSEIDHLEGQLLGFENVNEEQISIQKENLHSEKENFTQINIEFKKTELKYQQLKNLKTDFEVLKNKKETFLKLNSEKSEIDHLEVKTDVYEKAFRIFNPLISEKDKLENEITKQKKNKNIQVGILEKTEEKFDEIKKDLAAIFPKYEILNQTKTEENDLSLILQMLNFSEEIKILKKRTKNGSEKVKEVEAKQKLIRDKVIELSKKSEILKPKKLDASLLLNVGNWFSTRKNLSESEQKQVEKTQELLTHIQQIAVELLPFEINIETFKEDYNSKTDALEILRKEISDKIKHLEIQQKLSHFAHELHDGESCPLCGATEHPNIVEFADVNSELEEIKKKLENIEDQQKEIQKKSLEAEKILDRKQFLEVQLKVENEGLSKIKIEVENHQKKFIWKMFNPENETEFNIKKEESFAIEKQLEALAENSVLEQKNLETEQENFNNYNKILEKLTLDEAKKEEQINTNETNLKILNWKNFKEKSVNEVEENYRQLSRSNLKTEQNYQILVKQEKEISPKLAEQKTDVKNLEKRISELETEISAYEKSLSDSLKETQFENLTEVGEIISQEINIQESRNKIQKYRIDFEIVKTGIAELEEKLKDYNFDENHFLQIENQFKTIENDQKNANNLVIKLTSEIERLEKEFKKKEALLKELSQLQKRAENLKIMTNLFKGAGFVQYVSSIYLRQLCDHANIRFHRMTRNQLSLQLNENNDFEIVDYLNEGRSRSVKTLSGGQSFQVSLSLALALAESVQTNAKAEKNFFFIDEGFGTQDLESVNVVFETLMSLQKENRIVGIISHVEELKEKIPVSLTIVKDEERGSLISF